jgi:hypothetical protein
MFLQDIILQQKIKKQTELMLRQKKYIASRIQNIKRLARFNQKSLALKNSFFNPNKTFYVCSYGGCGSTVLSRYLRCFGNVEHIHSRFPPQKLEYVGKKNTQANIYHEWFNSVPIPENDIHQYKVIYIYRNPVDSILSRFYMKLHLQHIQCKDSTLKIKDILEKKQDLYNVEEFYNNYTIPNMSRNYKIHCVKYENFFENIKEFNEIMGIPDVPKLYPPKIEHEKKKSMETKETLGEIYKNMIDKMQKMPFIHVV